MSVGFYPCQNVATEDSACACTRLPVLTRLGLVDTSSSSEEREHFQGEIAIDLEGQYVRFIFIIGSPIGEETVDDYRHGESQQSEQHTLEEASSLRASEAASYLTCYPLDKRHAKG